MRQDLLFSLLMLGLVTGSLANPTLPRAVFELHRAALFVIEQSPDYLALLDLNRSGNVFSNSCSFT